MVSAAFQHFQALLQPYKRTYNTRDQDYLINYYGTSPKTYSLEPIVYHHHPYHDYIMYCNNNNNHVQNESGNGEKG